MAFSSQFVDVLVIIIVLTDTPPPIKDTWSMEVRSWFFVLLFKDKNAAIFSVRFSEKGL